MSHTFAIVVTKRTDQVKFGFELHKEANGRDMYSAQTAGSRLLARYSESISLEELYLLEPDASDQVFHVLQFYQRLWLSIKHKQIHLEMVPDLFGEPFVWWHQNCFEKQLLPSGLHGAASNQMEELQKWLKAHTPARVYREWELRQRKGALSRRPLNDKASPTSAAGT